MKLKVMVVDDETPICQWLAYCIRRASEDYVVFSASNGEEAYEIILKEKPDIVFTDICMPDMDGLELMKKTLEVLPFTVFAILTNYAEFSYARQAVSLGAREYFLKSELRSTDMEKLLTEVFASKSKKLNEKTDDVFQSGCIDLYNLYAEQREQGYVDRFWEKHGMWADVPYQVLCVTGGSRPAEWQEVASAARNVMEQSGGSAYLAAASEKGWDYVVVQSNNDREKLIGDMVSRLSHRSVLGVSSVLYSRNDFVQGLRESALAWQAAFFDTENQEIINFVDISKRQPLNRELLLEQREVVLASIVQRNYQDAVKLLQQWFLGLGAPGSDDMKWAVDCCRRMVLSVEEQYHQELKASPVEMEVQQNVKACYDRCVEMVCTMERNHIARCSPSIATAIDYIHVHYHEDVSMAEVARQIYRSPEYFSRQFKEEVGENFNTYLTLYRLDRAQELLDKTDLRIAEIAERVGYVTPGYFSRIYKKYRGITPEQARMSKK